jgi:hypothetical protein
MLFVMGYLACPAASVAIAATADSRKAFVFKKLLDVAHVVRCRAGALILARMRT